MDTNDNIETDQESVPPEKANKLTRGLNDAQEKLREFATWITNKLTTWNVGRKARGTVQKVPRWIRVLANDSLLGFLLGASAAYLLTFVTYLAVNTIFLSSSITRFQQWQKFDQHELSQAYLAASGEHLSADNELDALAKIKSSENLNLEIVYRYEERNAFKRKDDDPEFEGKKRNRVMAMLQDWDGLSLEEAEALVMGNKDDTVLLQGSDNTRLRSLANARPVKAFVFRWGKDAEFRQELVLERVSNSPLKVVASFRPVFFATSPEGVDVERLQRAIVESDFEVLTEGTVPGCFGLRPISVQQDASSLASQFFPLFEKNIRGLRIKGALVTDQDSSRPSSVEEDAVRVILTQLIGRRMPPQNNAQQTKKFPTLGIKEEVLIEDRPAKLESAAALFAWRRIFNGSDFWGQIQYWTFWCFYYLMIILYAKWRLARIQSTYLHRNAVFEKFGDGDTSAKVDLRLEQIEALRLYYRGDDNDKKEPDRICIPLEIMHAGCSGMSRGGYHEVPGFVNARSTHLLERIGTSLVMVRYFAWAIPSIGFVGTVLGIGNALLGTGGVLAEDKIAQQTSIQGMAQSLGTAFDTTFIALILSIIAVAYIHVVQRSYEGLVHDSVDQAVSALVDPTLKFTVIQPTENLGTGNNKSVPDSEEIADALPVDMLYVPRQPEPMRRIYANFLRDLVVITSLSAVTLAALSYCFPGSALANYREKVLPKITQSIQSWVK